MRTPLPTPAIHSHTRASTDSQTNTFNPIFLRQPGPKVFRATRGSLSTHTHIQARAHMCDERRVPRTHHPLACLPASLSLEIHPFHPGTGVAMVARAPSLPTHATGFPLSRRPTHSMRPSKLKQMYYFSQSVRVRAQPKRNV